MAEQLNVAAELLASGSLAKARMALVAADNLAELLLSRHARRVFSASEGSHWMKRRRYGAKERDKILGDFKRKVALARKPAERPMWRAVEPILDDGDASLMRVAHRYRNGVYHEDRHNETLLTPLTALYLQAVGRTFCRGYEPGTAWGGGLKDQVAPLEKWGYKLTDQPGREETFEFRAAAEQVTSWICDPLKISLRDLKDVLLSDLLLRNDQVLDRFNALLNDGMPLKRLTFVVSWSQFWDTHGADEQAQELEERRRELTDRLRDSAKAKRKAVEAELNEVEAMYIDRWHELQEGFTPKVTIQTIEDIARLAPRLKSARKPEALLERYEALDGQVRTLENAAGEAANAWSEMVSSAEDAARGN